MAKDKTIHLGITMAGAISAGAYTAGVLDYLFEVLEKWDSMKNDPRYDGIVPRHNVVIDVMSGASAGGMTACIASLAVQRPLYPITTFCHLGDSYDESVSSDDITTRKGRDGGKGKNRFYDSWVNLKAPDMIPRMLETDDLTKIAGMDGPGYVSGLNSKFIDDVARRTLELDHPEIPLRFPPFISPELRTFVTLANLDGFKREIPFSAGVAGFISYDHRDLAYFAFGPNASDRSEGCIRVDLTKASAENTITFRESAVATGAFPIGLAYRTFPRHRDYIEKNVLLLALNGGKPFKLDPNDVGHNNLYTATLVDGGTLDNEPFELTRALLEQKVPGPHTSNGASFNSTILMIDPFPSEDRPPLRIDTASKPFSLLGAAAALFSTVRGQSMLKTDDIESAVERTNYSRFLISPKRRIEHNDPINGSRAIACGSLGGFGGFLDKRFRRHDFYLGRINCKSFLQRHFLVGADDAAANPIFSDSYGSGAHCDAIRQKFGRSVAGGGDGEFGYPIIPDVNRLLSDGDVDDLYYELRFPALSLAEFDKKFDTYRGPIKGRVSAILRSYSAHKPLAAICVRVGLFFLGNKLLQRIYDALLDNLTTWELIK